MKSKYIQIFLPYVKYTFLLSLQQTSLEDQNIVFHNYLSPSFPKPEFIVFGANVWAQFQHRLWRLIVDVLEIESEQKNSTKTRCQKTTKKQYDFNLQNTKNIKKRECHKDLATTYHSMSKRINTTILISQNICD